MSSTRNILPPFTAIAAGSLSGNLTSAVTNVRNYRVVTIELVPTGTPTGTWAIQLSNLKTQSQATPPAANDPSWFTISIVPPLTWTGTATTLGCSFDKYAWEWCRAVFTAGEGSSGSVNMSISAQGV